MEVHSGNFFFDKHGPVRALSIWNPRSFDDPTESLPFRIGSVETRIDVARSPITEPLTVDQDFGDQRRTLSFCHYAVNSCQGIASFDVEPSIPDDAGGMDPENGPTVLFSVRIPPGPVNSRPERERSAQ